MIRTAIALVLLGVVGVAGCGGNTSRIPQNVPDPDRILFERAIESLEDRKWVAAREDFRLIIDNYPQSEYRAGAKLGVGDSYLGEGSPAALVLAISEFTEFLTFFPTHERADYAQYQLGMAHHVQMRSSDRDQTDTGLAIEEFETFVSRYPNSSLMDEARARLREARDRLSESEYRVGFFYYRVRWYAGAIDRFKRLLEDDPVYTRRDAVYYHLAESLLKSAQKAEALPYYVRLIEEFVSSEYLEEAQERIAELEGA